MNYKKEPIRDFPLYQVDTLGNIYNQNGSLKKYSCNKSGYPIVTFCVSNHKTSCSVHQIVAKQFIPNDDLKKYQVNHIDGDKQNNKIENLEWVTPSENMRHAVKTLGIEFGSVGRRAIVANNKRTGDEIVFSSASEAMKSLRLNEAARVNIWRALNGLRKSAYGYTWHYK